MLRKNLLKNNLDQMVISEAQAKESPEQHTSNDIPEDT